ncbi:MAG: Mfa1 fimbrilin C-terminal domain-containing protein [Prevotella sp.]|nr:Mfa1 fimbrilin C-terminal domain-containing protein [Prevotella sp.]
MKKSSFLALAAVGLLFGACSDKDVVEQSSQLNQYDMIEGQPAWVSLGIALPSDPITRSNEDLNDGDENEFNVYSAKLVLFKGISEDDAVLIKDYDITPEFLNETGDNTPGGGTAPNNAGEVSRTSKKIVKEIESPKLGGEENLYGYVILNHNGNLTGISYAPNTTFALFKAQVLKAIGIVDEAEGFGSIYKEEVAATETTAAYTKGGLVMTNVPIAATAGGEQASTGGITTLALISKDAIFKTKAAALESNAATACIYVERAAVKVEVINNVTKIELPYGTTDIYTAVTPQDGDNPSDKGWYEKEGDNYNLSADTEVNSQKTYYSKTTKAVTQLDFTFNGWALGNVNYGGTNGTGYYNTRQFDTDWLPYNNQRATAEYLQWRMVGRTRFFTSTDHTEAYRTYFGRDVNYTNAPSATNTFAATNLKNKQLADNQYTLASGAATYTYENTFDENSQIWANTTYVGVKLTVAGGDFYTIEGQPNTVLKLNDLPNEVAKNVSSTIATAITNIKNAIDADLAKTEEQGRTLPTTITKVTFSIEPELTLGSTRNADGSVSYTYVLKLTNVKDQNSDAITGTTLTTVETLAGTNITDEHNGTTKIYLYVGGATYYSMRISHFGDVETPWSAPAEAYNNYSLIYPTNGVSSHEANEDKVTYSNSRASAWLGRWGIVRNNWYQLTIDKIEGLGSPVPEDYSGEAGGTPDDNPEPKYYISAHVHILPWAVRKQSLNF